LALALCDNSDVLVFKDMNDEEVVKLANDNNAMAFEFLMYKYKNFVRGKARSYFLVGADRDDIIQEGMIGLFKAVRDYDIARQASFRSFAEICITRQIITAIKSATRQKHIPLNSYVSLNKPIYEEDSGRTLLDVIEESRVTDPMELFIGREEMDKIYTTIGEILSELELRSLMSYLDGKSYNEIAIELNRHEKSVDNALQRVKKKMERNLETYKLYY
jgi:RNA polymerase sporulation-specific sigma factor